MTAIRMQLGAIAAAFLAIGYTMPVPANAAAVPTSALPDAATDVSARARGEGGARAGGGNRNVNVNRNVNRNTNVNRNVNKNVNVNRNVNRNVSVNRRANVVVRPVRVWAPRPYYGTIIGGIALGTIIVASAAGTAPAAPGPNMCWFWVDSAQVQGYWDYCTPPY